ncbi:MAG TPA: 2OG-Fe dioxygenase family protein [Burkholderiaceae bacterium]
MSITTFAPRYTTPESVVSDLHRQGYAALSSQSVAAWAACPAAELAALAPDWDDLPPDAYLRDGGRYRRRRHACFVVEGNTVQQTAHRAHWQSVEYNALHGGIQRWFAPVLPETVARPAWTHLLTALARTASALKRTASEPAAPWYVEAHQFRIDTTDGIGRPTPEGAHRDGVDLVAVFLVARANIKGGETRVFEANGPNGQRFTLSEPWSLLLLDDTRVIHESTPIQPTQPGGHRDTLVLTCRAYGFQGDAGSASIKI